MSEWQRRVLFLCFVSMTMSVASTSLSEPTAFYNRIDQAVPGDRQDPAAPRSFVVQPVSPVQPVSDLPAQRDSLVLLDPESGSMMEGAVPDFWPAEWLRSESPGARGASKCEFTGEPCNEGEVGTYSIGRCKGNPSDC